MGVSDRSIRNWLKVLKNYEYIEIEFIYREGTKEIEQRKIRTRPHDDDFLQKVWKENYGEVWKDFSGGVEQNCLDNNKSFNNKEEKEIYKEKEESKTSKKQEEKSADFSSMQKELEEQINDIEFEKFWKVYPRKTDKTMARKRYLTALKNNDVTYETILKGAENYKAYTETEKQDVKFIKHAATWLNNKCWENEYKINSLNEKKDKGKPEITQEEREKLEYLKDKKYEDWTYEEEQLYYKYHQY